MAMIWELKHSVTADANRQTVWAWHSNVDDQSEIPGAPAIRYDIEP
jgi:hypothetical protein